MIDGYYISSVYTNQKRGLTIVSKEILVYMYFIIHISKWYIYVRVIFTHTPDVMFSVVFFFKKWSYKIKIKILRI